MQIIFLLVFAFSRPLLKTSAQKCLKDIPENVAKKYFKLTGNANIQLLPLRLKYGKHVLQQISTYTLKILAEEVLGYEDVVLVEDHSNLGIEDSLRKLSSCQRCSSSTMKNVPKVMVDTEVWVPTDFLYSEWIDKELLIDAGQIVGHGRYGWYMPTDFVQKQWVDNRIVADNWRSLQLKSIRSHLKQNQTLLCNTQNLTEVLTDCKGQLDCLGDVIGLCNGSSGDTLFNTVMVTDFPGYMDYFTMQQIKNLKLNITLLWLGSQLSKFIIEQLKSSGNPFLLLNWEPNVLASTGQLSRIFLPACRPEKSFLNKNSTAGCDFPFHHLKKFAWHKVKSGAPDFYHILEQMYFTPKQLYLLLHRHKGAGGTMSSYEAACHWLQQTRNVWLSWLPSGLHTGKVPVYLGGMFPMDESESALWVSPGILEGAMMAIQKVNEDQNVLSNYSLEMIVKNTQCQTSLVLNSYIDFVSKNRNYSLVGILGPACSSQAEIIAEVSPFYNTIVMGYSLEGVNLANSKKYPLFFRTSPSYFEFKKAYAALFDALGWKQYASLTDVNYASATVTATHEYMADKGVKLVYSRFIALQESADIRNYLRSIQKSHARIIFGSFFEDVAREVVCEAINQEMRPQDGYVWFLPSWLHSQWWIRNSSIGINQETMVDASLVPCTNTQMKEFVSGGYFSMANSFFGSGGEKVVGGYTVNGWKEEYKKNVDQKGHPPSDYASFAYDAVWAYAYALEKLFKMYPSSLDTIRTNITANRLKRFLQELNFSGVSGQVVFKDGERYLPTVNILQHFGKGKPVTVGQFVPVKPGDTKCAFYAGCLELYESLITWPGGSRPTDGRLEPLRQMCAVESFRRLTGLSCDWSIAVINIIAIGLFLIIVITFIWICIKRRYDKKYKGTRKRMEELGLMQQSPIMQLDDWEILREDVVLNRKLGEGAFGTVFGGEAKGFGEQSDWLPVAVKTLKPGSTPEEKLEFLSEAETMKIFEHKNIVKLLGVCTKGEPALTVMELMIHGDLKSFLLARRQFVNQKCKEADDVTALKLTAMALDIATGLTYLSELKFVHRDLALRNCMVGSGQVVKLGDFGMTRAMFDSDYYRFGRKGMLPVRWMAPESLADGVFTTKSDVWGLGVTLWELCTLGSFPYQGLSNSDVVLYVKDENIMEMPKGCSTQLVELLRLCWKADPNLRPEPITIMNHLTNHSESITPCLDAPIADITTDDDLHDTDSVSERNSSPRVISRKISRAFRQNTWSPKPGSSQKRVSDIQMTEDQFRAVLKCHSSSETPASERQTTESLQERREEFV